VANDAGTLQERRNIARAGRGKFVQRQRKTLASSNFGKSPRCFSRIPLAFVIHEQLVVY
jgi:hypothetical protein